MKRQKCYILVCCFFLLVLLTSKTVLAEDYNIEKFYQVDGWNWFDVSQWPTENQGWTDTEHRFDRLPLCAKEKVSESVWNLSQNPAGEVVRFRTNATTIRIKYKLTSQEIAFPHMPATGASGIDLYLKDEGNWKWAGCTKPVSTEATETVGCQWGGELDGKMREGLLYLPLYNGIEHLEIGVPETAEFHAVLPRKEKPILYYGTSIAQGKCCSRPGNAFTAMLSRRLNIPVLNFGFSGAAHMEPELAFFLAELDPCLFVIDASPNMTPELIDQNGVKFVSFIREKHPDLPILLVEDLFFSASSVSLGLKSVNDSKHNALRKVYENLVTSGDKNMVPRRKLWVE